MVGPGLGGGGPGLGGAAREAQSCLPAPTGQWERQSGCTLTPGTCRERPRGQARRGGSPYGNILVALLIDCSSVYTFCIFKIVCDREPKQNLIPLVWALGKSPEQFCWFGTWHGVCPGVGRLCKRLILIGWVAGGGGEAPGF